VSRRAWIAFAALSAIWSIPYLFIKIAVDGAYINPVIAVALGVIVLGESPGAGAIAGLLLILAGSWLSTDDRLPPNPTAIVTRLRAARAGPEAEASVGLRLSP
jgi:drug/metabolite transporter (DMT)-like permease